MGNPLCGPFANPQATDTRTGRGTEALRVALGGAPVHYRVTFRSGLMDMMNTPLVEAPILDDVTLYFGWESSRVLSWREEPR